MSKNTMTRVIRGLMKDNKTQVNKIIIVL